VIEVSSHRFSFNCMQESLLDCFLATIRISFKLLAFIEHRCIKVDLSVFSAIILFLIASDYY